MTDCRRKSAAADHKRVEAPVSGRVNPSDSTLNVSRVRHLI